MLRFSTRHAFLFFGILALTSVGNISAWVEPCAHSRRSVRVAVSQKTPRCTTRLFNENNSNSFKDLFNPYESKIPEELREEIYRAEANTPAARDRGTRIALYTLLAIVGISLATFNGFLTDMRDKETALRAASDVAAAATDSPNSLYVLEQNGFGWVLSNPIWKFLFTNKIGGILTLLLGGGSGLMAEAELDTKRLNAEKIYEELERRRAQKNAPRSNRRGPNNNESRAVSRKKRRSGKEKKRLAAISEVIVEDANEPETPSKGVGMAVVPQDEEKDNGDDETTAPPVPTAEDNKQQGILGKVKEFYDKADSMAASQALILNKNLEEAGVVEKITDESGLKVIGRDEAKKLEEKKITDESN